MLKTHITFVCGNPLPAFLSIQSDVGADRIILVYATQLFNEAQRIQEAVSAHCHPAPQFIFHQCDLVNVQQISHTARQLSEMTAGDKLTLSLVGANSLWTLLFYSIFFNKSDVKVLIAGPDNAIVDFATLTPVVTHCDLATRFSLLGTPLVHARKINEYTDNDLALVRQIQRARWKNIGDFGELTSQRTLDQIRRGENRAIAKYGSSLNYIAAENAVELNLVGRSHTYNYYWTADHILEILFNSGWFILWTAYELRGNKHMKDIWIDCRFANCVTPKMPLLSASSSCAFPVDSYISSRDIAVPRSPVNIIFDAGTNILLISCRTALDDSMHISSFHGAIQKAGCCLALMVSHDLIKSRVAQFDSSMEKCRNFGIQTYCHSLWKEHPTMLPTLNDIVDNLLETAQSEESLGAD